MSGHKKKVDICNVDELAAAALQTKETVNTPNCGTPTPNLVNSTVAAYLMNQERFHSMVLYDNVNCQINGLIAASVIAPTTINIQTSGLTFTNDVPRNIVIDYGTGFVDIIAPNGTSQFNYNVQAIGRYDIKYYVIMRSGNILYLGSTDITVSAATVLINTGTSVLPARAYPVTVAAAFQNYCDNIPIGTPYTFSTYSPLGTLQALRAPILDERIDVNEFENERPVTQTPAYTSVRRAFTPNTLPAAFNQGLPANCRFVRIYNTTASDITVTTSVGAQIIKAMEFYDFFHPSNRNEFQAALTGILTISFFNSVGANVLGAAPRIIFDFKAYQ